MTSIITGARQGPVSGMPFIEASLRYALKLVPKDKLVLGLPFYGRIWSDSGGYPKGYGVSNTKITQLLANYGRRGHRRRRLPIGCRHHNRRAG